LDNLPKRRMAPVEATRTDWLDPSIELTSDIQVPVKGADGSFAWQVLAARGTRVNPLAQLRPVTAMLFFDGADPAQLAAVEAVLKAEPMRVVPVEAGRGSLRESNERLARPVFHANDAMMGRFQIRHLPALVYPGMADRALFLGITSFAAPFSPREILSAWPELTQLPPLSETR
jgi:conjugal transfer pilus assembly protein TraW